MNPNSDYHNISKVNNALNNSQGKGISLLHRNIEVSQKT